MTLAHGTDRSRLASCCGGSRRTFFTRAAAEFSVRTVMLGGGVAANLALREEIARRISLPLRVPPPALCIANGAMIGAAAFYSLRYRSDHVPTLVRSSLPLAG